MTSNMGAMLRMSPRTPQYGREASPGQAIGNNREHGFVCFDFTLVPRL
jgi:hypothetical protein